MIARSLILAIFMTGLAGLVASRNLVKKTYALAIMNSAVVLLFVLEGATIGTRAPLLGGSPGDAAAFVDPVPQALMLTAIVVGVCVSALALALAFRLYRAYGTLDIDELRKHVDHE
ncbi:MAG: Na+/H+ antiporter subunit C [Spirochaetae bacterium HGW-Spirochaetae-7]|nr:MAG: Na+/H+ antiporter subunit C [Spirochaetae bacterium HGW-Spirochaetae-7]